MMLISVPVSCGIIHESLVYIEKCDFSGVNVLYTEMVKKMLFDQKSVAWMKCELVRLTPETSEFMIVVEKTLALHCSLGSFTLKFHFSNHLVVYLKIFKSFSFRNTGPFEHVYVRIKKS